MARSNARSGRPARRMDWGGESVSGSALPASSSIGIYALEPTTVRSNYTDPTVIAHRAILTIRMNGTSLGGGFAALGIIAWDDINDTPDEVPGPITLPNLDWLMRIVLPLPGSVPDGQIFTTALDRQYESRAMRRLGNTKGLLVVVENFGVSVTFNWAWDYRFLLKE